MYKNVCIILLIFLIVYLIYKISSNTCDCFSVSSQIDCSDYTILSCGMGESAFDCKWDNLTNKCEQRKRSLRPENPSQFLADINKAYGDKSSNGVFVSMFVNKGQMDASGSVLLKNTYNGVYGESCNFGFIWDTDWLDKNLVECLFPRDEATAYFDDDDCNQTIKTTNFCKLANTSGSNTPDRCSHGLFHSNNIPPYPTNCNQKIKYDLKRTL